MLEEVDDFPFRKWVKIFGDTVKSELTSILYCIHRGMYISDFPLMIWRFQKGFER
ncbi:MAG: hypothetical protein HXS44_13175 [Theionarchaea archaeon]|nr:hypothetical protein [Theionarchaea archaeon]